MQPMGYAAPGASPMAATGASYEFTELENATIAGTARYAKIWGYISLVTGVIMLVLGVVLVAALGVMMPAAAASGSGAIKPSMIVAVGAGLIPSSLVSVVGGIFYILSGTALRRVVDTQGNDIELLMDGVRSLSRAFMIEAIAMIVGFVAGLGIGVMMQMGGR